MAGDPILFQDALRKAHNYAWDRKWPEAVGEYRRALVEAKNDPLVWISLGAALVEMKRWGDARDAYQTASTLRPDDLSLQRKVAELSERLGNVENALQLYLNIAIALEKTDQMATAVEPWQAILRLQPAHIESHQHLAELLEKLQRYPEAARENSALARLLLERNRPADAEAYARKALILDPRNTEARAFVEHAQTVPDGGTLRLPLPSMLSGTGDSPTERARARALKRLADLVLEGAPQALGVEKGMVEQLARAIENQTHSRPAEAIAGYRQAVEAGARSAELTFTLGALYMDALDLDSAIAEFQRALTDRHYALAAHYAMACCYAARAQFGPAMSHLLDALLMVDSALIKPAQAAALTQAYRTLASRFAQSNTRDGAQHTSAIIGFFGEAGWLDRATQWRNKLSSVSLDGEILPLAELVGTGHAEQVLEGLTASQNYLKRAKLTAAIDECYRAIALAPGYLPLHAQLAEVYVSQGRVEAAVEKYKTIAALYRARGETERLAECYRRMLRCAPENHEVQDRLVELLLVRGEVAEAIDQQIAAGQSYTLAALNERALASYQAALRLIVQVGSDHWTVSVLHLMGDIYVQRSAWNEALAIYSQIRKLAVDDEKASLRLVDLYFRLGRDADSERELGHLIELYSQTNDAARLIPVVADMAAKRPMSDVLQKALARLQKGL